MSAPRLIGIGGRLTSGKDAVADHLVGKYGFVKLGMSDALLDAALVMNPIVGKWPNDTDLITAKEAVAGLGYVRAKEQYPLFRDFLQRLGTDFGRKMIDENIWVDAAERKINALVREGKSVVITGLRYPNEVQMIDQAGGQTWWVHRPSAEAVVSEHTSENSVSVEDFRYTVPNTGDLKWLYRAVDTLMFPLEPEPEPRRGIALTREEALALESALHADFPTIPISIIPNERHAA